MSHMKPVYGLLSAAAIVVSSVSCGDVARTGRSPMFLVIESLTATRGGASSAAESNTLLSDVQAIVTSPPPCSAESPCRTIFSDSGKAILRMNAKNIGTPDHGIVPTTNNEITVFRYRVVYRRADGRNTPGVDVPYPLEGAATGTIAVGGTLPMTFELVRHAAKAESPLVELVSNPTVISTVTEVTFYGRDMVGNEVSATGSMLIDFGNFGD